MVQQEINSKCRSDHPQRGAWYAVLQRKYRSFLNRSSECTARAVRYIAQGKTELSRCPVLKQGTAQDPIDDGKMWRKTDFSDQSCLPCSFSAEDDNFEVPAL